MSAAPPPGEPPPPDSPAAALYQGVNNVWKALAVGAVVLGIGIGATVLYRDATGSGAAAPAGTESPAGQPQGSTIEESPVGTGAVRLHIIAYTRPPCSLPIGITDMEPANADLSPGAGNFSSGSFPGPCTFVLTFRRGTKLTYLIHPGSQGGWNTAHTWDGPCSGSFQLTTTQNQPSAASVTCTTTLLQDQTLTITYEVTATEYQLGSGNKVYTADYPHCNDPASYPGPHPTPYPQGCT